MIFDKSARHYDLDKRLHVDKTVISIANVCPYYGREITDWKLIGLDPNKIYKLYRDPIELAKGAPTYHNVPLLVRHIAVNPGEPQQDSISGVVSNITFEHPNLYGSLAVWTQEGIDFIESGEQEQLSAGYYFKADMTPGTAPTGERYDGRMYDLVCNHVAQVKEGRVGPDSTVADQFPPELPAMKSKYPALAAKFKINDADMQAFDAALDEEKEKAEDAAREEAEDKACDYYGHDAKDWEAMDAKARDKARDEWEDEEEEKKKKAKDKKAKDEASKSGSEAFAGSKDEAITQPQMDAAIRAATDATAANVRKEMSDLFAAREAVKPLVGLVAMDSAEAVYAFALKHAGIATDGVHPSAFPALIAEVTKRKAAPAEPVFDQAAREHSIASIFH